MSPQYVLNLRFSITTFAGLAVNGSNVFLVVAKPHFQITAKLKQQT